MFSCHVVGLLHLFRGAMSIRVCQVTCWAGKIQTGHAFWAYSLFGGVGEFEETKRNQVQSKQVYWFLFKALREK